MRIPFVTPHGELSRHQALIACEIEMRPLGSPHAIPSTVPLNPCGGGVVQQWEVSIEGGFDWTLAILSRQEGGCTLR